MNIFIPKADTEIEVPDLETLPVNSQEYLKDYMWKQVLNDAVAAIAVIDGQVCINKVPLKDTPASKFADIVIGRVQKKLDSIVKGEVKIASTRIGSGDPLKAEAIDMAIEMTVRGEFKKAGKPLEAKAMRARAIELVGRNPAYLHLAQSRFDKRAEEAAMIAKMEADMMNQELVSAE